LIKVNGSNVLFTGDNYATTWGPNVGFVGIGHQIDVINKALSLTDEHTIVVPGHGNLGLSKDLLD
jgi:glyoxylase-like metal-dependent hydrolase (beta-lactamase superfamily II)